MPADKAYGNHDPDIAQPVPRTNFEGIKEIKPGMQLKPARPRARASSVSSRLTPTTSRSTPIIRSPASSSSSTSPSSTSAPPPPKKSHTAIPTAPVATITNEHLALPLAA